MLRIKVQKLQRVNDFDYAEFIHAREYCLPLHDSDFKTVGYQKGS